MHDTVCDEDIWDDDACGIYVDGSVLDSDFYAASSYGLQGGVGEERSVADGAVHDVVFEDLSQLGGGEGANCGTDGLEGSIGWREDGYVVKGVDC
jgi:hypothetical protein